MCFRFQATVYALTFQLAGTLGRPTNVVCTQCAQRYGAGSRPATVRPQERRGELSYLRTQVCTRHLSSDFVDAGELSEARCATITR
ncbi:hypothetical protein T492DRAFT_946898 [Pavlovales sp. CCMP2436]|nr:hypothetical protein T492DRAFT_946898 [Pavlovales sp. CCMP2436]